MVDETGGSDHEQEAAKHQAKSDLIRALNDPRFLHYFTISSGLTNLPRRPLLGKRKYYEKLADIYLAGHDPFETEEMINKWRTGEGQLAGTTAPPPSVIDDKPDEAQNHNPFAVGTDPGESSREPETAKQQRLREYTELLERDMNFRQFVKDSYGMFAYLSEDEINRKMLALVNTNPDRATGLIANYEDSLRVNSLPSQDDQSTLPIHPPTSPGPTNMPPANPNVDDSRLNNPFTLNSEEDDRLLAEYDQAISQDENFRNFVRGKLLAKDDWSSQSELDNRITTLSREDRNQAAFFVEEYRNYVEGLSGLTNHPEQAEKLPSAEPQQGQEKAPSETEKEPVPEIEPSDYTEEITLKMDGKTKKPLPNDFRDFVTGELEQRYRDQGLSIPPGELEERIDQLAEREPALAVELLKRSGYKKKERTAKEQELPRAETWKAVKLEDYKKLLSESNFRNLFVVYVREKIKEFLPAYSDLLPEELDTRIRSLPEDDRTLAVELARRYLHTIEHIKKTIIDTSTEDDSEDDLVKKNDLSDAERVLALEIIRRFVKRKSSGIEQKEVTTEPQAENREVTGQADKDREEYNVFVDRFVQNKLGGDYARLGAMTPKEIELQIRRPFFQQRERVKKKPEVKSAINEILERDILPGIPDARTREAVLKELSGLYEHIDLLRPEDNDFDMIEKMLEAILKGKQQEEEIANKEKTLENKLKEIEENDREIRSLLERGKSLNTERKEKKETLRSSPRWLRSALIRDIALMISPNSTFEEVKNHEKILEGVKKVESEIKAAKDRIAEIRKENKKNKKETKQARKKIKQLYSNLINPAQAMAGKIDILREARLLAIDGFSKNIANALLTGLSLLLYGDGEKAEQNITLSKELFNGIKKKVGVTEGEFASTASLISIELARMIQSGVIERFLKENKISINKLESAASTFEETAARLGIEKTEIDRFRAIIEAQINQTIKTELPNIINEIDYSDIDSPVMKEKLLEYLGDSKYSQTIIDILVDTYKKLPLDSYPAVIRKKKLGEFLKEAGVKFKNDQPVIKKRGR